MRHLTFILTLLLLTGFTVKAQQQISGTVTNAGSGDPIPGVTIYVKSQQTIGTTTNMDGNYTLSGVPGDAETLVFSFVGMETQEVAIQGRNQIDVQLQPTAQELEQVVVTALGIRREEKRLGYSVSQVSGDEMAEAEAINPIEALQGQAAGINIESTDGGVFGGSQFSIRGPSTLGNDNMPIFVVDGVILDNAPSGGSEWSANPSDWGNQIRNLNPQNFESVSILKGSAATALYGSRAINGAVVIETKSGERGQGLGIRVNHTSSMRYVYDTPELNNTYGPGTVAGFVSYGDTDANGDYYRFDTRNQFAYRTVDGEQVPSLLNMSGIHFGPKYSENGNVMVEDYDHTMVPYRPRPNNWINAYDVGFTNNTNLTLDGGSDETTFYLSMNFKQDKDIYPKTRFNKYSGMLKASHDLTDFLTIHGSMTYTHSNPQNPPENFGSQFTAYSFNRMYNTKKYNKEEVWQADHGGTPSNAYGDEYADVPGNSFWFNMYKDFTERRENTYRPIVRVTADATDWLSFTAEGNMNIFNETRETKNLGSDYQNEGGSYYLRHGHNQRMTGKLTGQVNREFGDFIFDATLGGELYYQKSSNSWVETRGGLTVPGQFFIGNSKRDRRNSASVGGEKQINSAYALLSLSWKNQLYLDVTGRNDWSSALVYANGTGNYSYFYPSISGSWIFSDSFGLPGWISFGKLRASWAEVGNDTDPYYINQGYSVSTQELPTGNIYTNGVSTTLFDPDLSPEQKQSVEFGANMQFFNGRLGFDFTYYKENTYDQILDIPAPSISGVSNQRINAGNIQNKGIELSVNGSPLRTNDFSWDLTFNYTRNRNKIISLHPTVGEWKNLSGSPSYGNYRIGSAAFIGGEYGVLLSDSKARLYEGENTEYHGKRQLTWNSTTRTPMYQRSDVQRVGSIQPDFVGSIKSAFSYKNLSFSFLLDGRIGGDVASFTSRYGTAWGYLESSTKAHNVHESGISWTSQYEETQGREYTTGVIPKGVFADGTQIQTPDGSTQDVGGMTFQEAYDEGYVEPAFHSAWQYWQHSWGTGVLTDQWFYELSYLALRNVSLSYSFPRRIAESIGFQSLNLGLKARNVLYLYNNSPNKMHPEGFRGNQSSYSYFERTPAPYSRTISLRLNLGF